MSTQLNFEKISLIFNNEEAEEAFLNKKKTCVDTCISVSIYILFLLCGIMIIINLVQKISDENPSDLSLALLFIEIALVIAEFIIAVIKTLRRIKGCFVVLCCYFLLANVMNYEEQGLVIPMAISVQFIVFIICINYSISWISVSISCSLGVIFLIVFACIRYPERLSVCLTFLVPIIFIMFVFSWNSFQTEYANRLLFLHSLQHEREKKQYKIVLDHIPEGIIISQGKKILIINNTMKYLLECLSEAQETAPLSEENNFECIFRQLENAKDVETEITLRNLIELEEDIEITKHMKIEYLAHQVKSIEASLIPIEMEGEQCRLTVLKDITESESLIKEQIESKMKKALIASVTHEIRNPLNIELGILETIKETQELTQIYNYAELGRKNMRLLSHLVNGIPDLYEDNPINLQIKKDIFYSIHKVFSNKKV